ncbi:hypothetical protein SESBI_15725 [Sesbania bispinosa]|nr:hypothetical protein SESBI_15725 [Sesbania bispinosa]
MEGIEMEEPAFILDKEANDDFCNSILSRFGNSTAENHQHLCAVIGAMSQELKDHNLPSSPVAYFGATCSSLDRIASEPNSPNHLIDTLLTILSLLIARVPVAVLKKKREFLSELVERVLRSQSASESAVVCGLKCLSHLLINRDSVNWSDVSLLFNVLLDFITDSRPKVRKQSHSCLRDVLLNLQNSSLLASASEGVTNRLEKCLLLAGGANTNTDEGTNGAQQVLYILDALKECLPFLSLKYKNSILKYFKTLLDLRQPLVTRRITDGLNFLCVYPTSEIPPEALLELLNSLALSISSNEMSGDGLTFTARLLDAGMNKIHSINRQICVIKLPIIFNALKDILASEHEEAIYAATDALKSIINSCVDESLIKQGVDQITLSDKESRRSGPTIIEKICATVESLLDYHYTAVWDRVFQVVSAMFHKLGNNSTYFMGGILKNLEDVQKLPDEDFPFRKQLHACLGSALVAMGPETLLSLVPLNLEAEDLSDANIWLFPILKQYTVCARLSYFVEEILPMIKRVRGKARKLEKQGLMVSSRNADALAYSLWSLLPSFCNYPLDTSKSFTDLEKHLRNELKEQPDIRGIICTSLQLLIQQNKNIADSNDKDYIGQDMVNEVVLIHYSQQVAKENLDAMKLSAKNLLKDLSEVFLETTKDDGGCLQRTIGDVASIAYKEDVQNLFEQKMWKLYKCIQKASKVDNSKNSMQIDDASNNVSPLVLRARLLDLAVSLLPGLDDEHITLLFQAIKPALQDAEGVMQKKAYKVLSITLKSSDSFVSSKFEELLGLMLEILPSSHFSAKRHRLDCLYFLIVHVSKTKDNLEHWREIVGSFLTEIILSLKEANKKTRNRAYDILVEIAHAFGDEERGGNRENLYQFFNMVAGGLAGETPHMISAAAKGLARLAYEFSDLVLTAFNLLPSTFLLLQRKNREIIKANLGFLKVLVAKSQAEGLQMHLRGMVEGLLKWQDNTKSHFKAKIKERKERDRGAKSEETRSHLSKATTARSNIRQKKSLPEHLSDQLMMSHLICLIGRKQGRGIEKKKSADLDYDERSERDSHLSAKSGTKSQKRRKTSDSGWAYTGKEYGSKKAGGDVKRKDKLEPYAYWPLDRKMMSRRPQHRARCKERYGLVL